MPSPGEILIPSPGGTVPSQGEIPVSPPGGTPTPPPAESPSRSQRISSSSSECKD